MTTRPLFGISDFVADGKLAQALELPSPKLVATVEWMIAALTPEHIARAKEGNRMLATLDLKMIEAGLVHSKLEAPEGLIALVDEFSGDELSVILYDEIVMANPKQDTRTFTRGEIGHAEAMFYDEHRLAEDQLAHALTSVRRAIGMLASNSYNSKTRELLDGVVENVYAVIRSTAKLRNEMDPAHFLAFRPFLMSHPVRDLKGPSGQYTARIPILDLLLHGEQLPTSYMTYIDENWAYFPREGRAEIKEVLAYVVARKTLRALWQERGEPSDIGASLTAIGNALTAFRKMHYRTVQAQIPEVAWGKAAGTGGEEDAGAFMRRRMEETILKLNQK